MLLRFSLKILAGSLALASLAGCMPEAGNYTGVATPKRNEVQMVRLTHPIYFADNVQFDIAEGRKLDSFLNEFKIGYGDVISLDAGESDRPTWRRAVQEHLNRRGLALDNRVVVSGPMPRPGTAVLVVDRYVVTTPNCNDFSQEPSKDYSNSNSPNYGCATEANLGLMVANPRDLVQGAEDSGPNAEAAGVAVASYLSRIGSDSQNSGSGNQ